MLDRRAANALRLPCRILAAVAATLLFGVDAKAIDVASQTDWNTAMNAVAMADANSTVAINFTGDFTLTSSLGHLQANSTGVTVNIIGGSHTIDGASSSRGRIRRASRSRT